MLALGVLYTGRYVYSIELGIRITHKNASHANELYTYAEKA